MLEVDFRNMSNSDTNQITKPVKINKTKTSLGSVPPDTPVHTPPTNSYIRNFYLEYICGTLYKKN